MVAHRCALRDEIKSCARCVTFTRAFPLESKAKGWGGTPKRRSSGPQAYSSSQSVRVTGSPNLRMQGDPLPRPHTL
ncbi:hypothetical protein CPT_Shaeky_089 [Streptomyces phage Shaeky]|uniref:Uncharacterized protein n=1 Tax=Streptomyces phage Shaeky TaxID=2767586 RepID=A0A873WEC2_9CAUD|nr:hypothetical protein CPT_Shaeky_089 [Streptomyces phage Shaeky]